MTEVKPLATDAQTVAAVVDKTTEGAEAKSRSGAFKTAGAALGDPAADLHTDHQSLGRDIGFAFVRYGVALPEDSPKAVVEGALEARHFLQNTRGRKIEPSGPYDRKLLRLRLSAYKRGRFVSDSVTPQFLADIDVHYCPITRTRLTRGLASDTDATIDRIYNDGAYAAGNLMVMSMRANQAKTALLPDEILEVAKALPADAIYKDLTKVQWLRMYCLTYMCQPPEVACADSEASADGGIQFARARHGAPEVFVYPPPGVYVTSPFAVIQQALSHVCAGIARPAERWAKEFRERLKGKALKKQFDLTIKSLSAHIGASLTCDEETLRMSISDAWFSEVVSTNFGRLMNQASKADQEHILATSLRVLSSGYGRVKMENLNREWALQTRGYSEGSIDRAAHARPAMIEQVAEDLSDLLLPKKAKPCASNDA